MYEKIKVKSLIQKQKYVDSWLKCKYTINPYIGCYFSCLYCYANTSRYVGKYFEKSNFFDKVLIKENAIELLNKEIKKVNLNLTLIGSSTDPYQPIEEKQKLTRKILQILYKNKFPVEIWTKSSLILRDLKLLKKISEENFLVVLVTLSTLNENFSKVIEPKVSIKSRIKLIEKLKEENIKVCLAAIPLINFDEVEEMAKLAKELNVDYFMAGELTLYEEVKERLKDILNENYFSMYNGIYLKREFKVKFYDKVNEVIRKYKLKSKIDFSIKEYMKKINKGIFDYI